MKKRINLISGPRNISTALMYSFDHRSDTVAIDEPMYAYYLDHTGIIHPGREDVLEALPRSIDVVVEEILMAEYESDYLFIKGMAHHYHGIEDLSFMTHFDNVFLIREPRRLIASFAQVIDPPTLQDIGLRHEWELYEYLLARGQNPIVIDSGELLQDPESYLRELCRRIDIPFSEEMLQWTAGPRSCDGVWARYWYENVWKSTGFAPQRSSQRDFPDHLSGLLEEAQVYYDHLYEYALKTI